MRELNGILVVVLLAMTYQFYRADQHLKQIEAEIDSLRAISEDQHDAITAAVNEALHDIDTKCDR